MIKHNHHIQSYKFEFQFWKKKNTEILEYNWNIITSDVKSIKRIIMKRAEKTFNKTKKFEIFMGIS